MNKIKILLLLVATAFAGNASAQTTQSSKEAAGTVSGRVLEMDGELQRAVESASVRALSLPDSSYVSGVATDSVGNFRLKGLKQGKYAILVELMGYETISKNVQLTAQNPSAALGDIMLANDDVLLADATVTAAAIQVSVREDSIVYNANAFRVQEGSMLEDLIKKLPGAEISDEGVIKINGKEVKKILVNGEEFFSDDPKVAAKNLPANMVDKLKNYERKSDFSRTTGIDDGEEEVVLDLEVKKDMLKGWSGNVFAGMGSESRYEAALNANRFRQDGHLTIIGNANNTNNKGYNEMGDGGRGGWGGNNRGVTASKSAGLTFAREFSEKLKVGADVRYGHSSSDASTKRHSDTQFTDSTGEFSDSYSSSVRTRDDYNMNARIEWKPDTLTTLIFRPNFSASKTTSGSNSNSRTDGWDYVYDPAGAFLRIDTAGVNENLSSSQGEYSNFQIGGNLNFIRRLNSKGRNFSINLRYNYQKSTSDDYSYSKLDYFQAADRSQQYNRFNDGENTNHSLNAGFSYSEPLWTGIFLQFNYNFSYRKATSNRYGYEYDYADHEYQPSGWDDVNWGALQPDTTLSSCYENLYMTHDVGLNMRHVTDKYNLSYGVSLLPQRSETNNIFGPNMDRGKITQDVLNWSPNLNFRYRFTKQESLRVRYRGRSSAPSIDNLQEVISKTDPQNIRYGNPGLKPSFSHNVNIDYNRFNIDTRRSFITFANFSTTQNNTTNMTLYDRTTGARVSRIMNINGNWNGNINFGFNTPLDSKNRFFINTFSHAGYSENVSLDNANMELSEIQQIVNDHGGKGEEITSVTDLSPEQINWFSAPKSKTRNLTLGQNLSASYQNDWLEFRLNGSINYSKVTNNTQETNNRETFDYRAGGNTTILLPWNISLATDCNYTHRQGYSAGLKNNEVMWNAQISKSFLKGNAATIRFKIYDILREQSNVSRSISAITITDTEYNTLGSYFMFNFIYKFNTLGKDSGSADRRQGPPGMGGGRPMGPPMRMGDR